MQGQTNMFPDTLKKQRTYLFYYGDECKNITGGWTTDNWYWSGFTNSKIMTIVNNYIYLIPDTSNTVPIIGTVNKIDLSPFETLCFRAYITSTSSSNYLRCGLADSENITSAEFGSAGAACQINTLTTYCYNIASINTSKYVHILNHGAGGKANGKIYEIYLM